MEITSTFLVGRNSSVGRALDWRSKGPRFNPGFRHRASDSGGRHCFFFTEILVKECAICILCAECAVCILYPSTQILAQIKSNDRNTHKTTLYNNSFVDVPSRAERSVACRGAVPPPPPPRYSQIKKKIVSENSHKYIYKKSTAPSPSILIRVQPWNWWNDLSKVHLDLPPDMLFCRSTTWYNLFFKKKKKKKKKKRRRKKEEEEEEEIIIKKKNTTKNAP